MVVLCLVVSLVLSFFHAKRPRFDFKWMASLPRTLLAVVRFLSLCSFLVVFLPTMTVVFYSKRRCNYFSSRCCVAKQKSTLAGRSHVLSSTCLPFLALPPSYSLL